LIEKAAPARIALAGALWVCIIIVLLYPFGPLFKPPWRQAVASPPVIEPGLLVAPQPAVHRATTVLGAVATQNPVQDPRHQPPHLRHRQRRRPSFFPAWFLGSETRWRPATAFGGDASPPRCGPGSRPGPPPSWHA